MPELPEVETTRRGIAPHIVGQQVTNLTIRQRKLRWPVPRNLASQLVGQHILSVQRRAKYLLLETENGNLIIHLGMSGSLRVVNTNIPAEKHDHIDIVFNNGSILRLRDPRRFGAVLWCKTDPSQHKLLNRLGVEPLSRQFNGDYLYQRAQKRKVAVKQFIMDSHIVVGVGNIYASEALFLAGIRPTTATGDLSRKHMDKLAAAIRQVLRKALNSGGTSLRDFTRSDGRPGYFQQKLNVYNRANLPCRKCGNTIQLIRQGQRATYFCAHCQI